MDSITQIALGAAVGEAVAGRQVGRKASLWGAVCGTIPDLDVLIPMGDAVRDFTYHRAASHSLFFMTMATPIVVWLITRIHPATKQHMWRWAFLVLLAFYTHAILDSFTVYGTQMYLPFSNYPVGWSTIFVIDPIYTIPLLIGVLSQFFIKRSPDLAYTLNILGLIVSSLYLLWTVGVKYHVDSIAEASLEQQNIEVTQVITGPSPFNTVLWRAVAMTDSGYVEGFYSLLDDKEQIHFNRYKSDRMLLQSISDTWVVQRLQWFSKGFYKVSEENDRIIMTDLRMGVEPLYFFRFVVGGVRNGAIVSEKTEQVDPPQVDMKQSMIMLWQRIWDDSITRLYAP